MCAFDWNNQLIKRYENDINKIRTWWFDFKCMFLLSQIFHPLGWWFSTVPLQSAWLSQWVNGGTESMEKWQLLMFGISPQVLILSKSSAQIQQLDWCFLQQKIVLARSTWSMDNIFWFLNQRLRISRWDLFMETLQVSCQSHVIMWSCFFANKGGWQYSMILTLTTFVEYWHSIWELTSRERISVTTSIWKKKCILQNHPNPHQKEIIIHHTQILDKHLLYNLNNRFLGVNCVDLKKLLTCRLFKVPGAAQPAQPVVFLQDTVIHV